MPLPLASFSFFMPILGFFLVKSFAGFAPVLMTYVSLISTIILCYLGGRMIFSGYRKNKETEEAEGNLLFQAVGTSVDALSLGFTFSQDSIPRVVLSALIIGLVTFILSHGAIVVGKKFGTVYAGNADILGGVVLLVVAILL